MRCNINRRSNTEYFVVTKSGNFRAVASVQLPTKLTEFFVLLNSYVPPSTFRDITSNSFFISVFQLIIYQSFFNSISFNQGY